MNLLLDTHVMIWFMTDDKRLPEKNKEQIEDEANSPFVSIASFWEIGIKHSLNKLTLNTDLSEIFQLVGESGLEILPITPEQILTLTNLPFHHRDPFDRLLIAQTKTEGMNLMTKDPWIGNYDINVVW